jgi:monofunctional biosynthetic peptidoglycan transglycosylase
MRRAARALARSALAAAAAGFGCLIYIFLTLPDVRPLRTQNPATTAFMELRAREALAQGNAAAKDWRWVSYAHISANLKRAVIVTEDDAFWKHGGVDYDQLRESMEVNWERGEFARGASTITQQLAKNLYLSPSYDPLRKVKELIIARRLEAALSKTRIFEIYLNVIEWGDRVWGAEAAARTYFDVPAASLSRQQSALLAGAIINPRLLTPARPTRRLLRRQQIILARMGGDQPVPSVATTPDLETDSEPDAVVPPRFPLTVDEEEAQEEETEAPAESAPAPSVEESPPA